MKYIIPGDPVALARCRFGKGRAWDGQKDLKIFWGIHLHNQHQRLKLYTGPLHIDVAFFMRLPKFPKRHQFPNAWHIKIPDLSNLIKFIEDVGTGILYHDDCIISSIAARKVYDNNERTELIITELK